MAEQAHCLVCNRPGDFDGNFLCDTCADPEKIIISCACGARYEISPDGPLAKKMSAGLGFALRAGTALKSAGCHKCSTAKKTKVTCFRIKHLEN